jgi:hypothetical protein
MDQTSEPAGIEPTIVLIGGSPSNESYWERLAERLQEQGFIVVAPPSGSRNVGVDERYGRRVVSESDGPVLVIRPSDGDPLRTDAPTVGGRRPKLPAAIGTAPVNA